MRVLCELNASFMRVPKNDVGVSVANDNVGEICVLFRNTLLHKVLSVLGSSWHNFCYYVCDTAINFLTAVSFPPSIGVA